MNKATNKQRILRSVVFVVLLVALIPLYQHMSQEIVSGGPHIQLVIGEDRSVETLPNGHYVGANYVYHNDGKYLHENIPTLQGLWQLDEPYAERSSINIEEDAEFISVFCALGKFRQLPNDILIVRFETDVIEGQPGSSPDWSDGEVVPYERHGNFYRIYDVAPGVYVARTVWDDGVLETAWTVEKN